MLGCDDDGWILGEWSGTQKKNTRCRILSQSQCVFAIYLKNETMKVNRQFWSHFFSDYLWGGAEKNGAPGHLGTGGSWTELAQGVKCFCRWLFHHSQNQNTQPLSWDGECFRGHFIFLIVSSLHPPLATYLITGMIPFYSDVTNTKGWLS